MYMNLYKRAKELRRNATKAERILWKHLSNKKLNNLKFRSQAVIENRYIADFYFAEKKLIIEVDGDIHLQESTKENDLLRTQYLNDCNYHVIRFRNAEVLNDVYLVLIEILKVIERI